MVKKVLNTVGILEIVIAVLAGGWAIKYIFQQTGALLSMPLFVKERAPLEIPTSDESLVITQRYCNIFPAQIEKDKKALEADMAAVFSRNTWMGYDAKTKTFTVYDQDKPLTTLVVAQGKTGTMEVKTSGLSTEMEMCISVTVKDPKSTSTYILGLVLVYDYKNQLWEYIEVWPPQENPNNNSIDA